MSRRVLTLAVVLLLLVGGAGVAVAAVPPRLAATGPTAVSGSDATAVFEVGRRTVRQVRYRDRGVLVYRFQLRNDGSLPVTVTGWRPPQVPARLFHLLALTDAAGQHRFVVPPGRSVPVQVEVQMTSCETLSARAGSFLAQVDLATTRAGLLNEVVRVRLPEELHTGSPREAYCPRATASSRPPG